MSESESEGAVEDETPVGGGDEAADDDEDGEADTVGESEAVAVGTSEVAAALVPLVSETDVGSDEVAGGGVGVPVDVSAHEVDGRSITARAAPVTTRTSRATLDSDRSHFTAPPRCSRTAPPRPTPDDQR